MEGLLGLTNNIKDTNTATRELSVLETMDNRVRSDRAGEALAQKEEALMYERMYKMSDEMLEKDRNQINKRIGMAQDQITSHMRDSGGSKKRFMEQGGLSAMSKISNDIMRSPESVKYQENKKNLAKILELQEKELGHLISPKDLQSWTDYQSNENGGTISFSGVMSNIEMPPPANFDYGTDIPLEKILSNGSNMMRIKSNYAMTYPDRPEPNHGDLLGFAKLMGYGGTGSNTARMRAASAEAIKKAQYKKNKKANAKGNSFVGRTSELFAFTDKGTNIKTLNGNEETGESYHDNRKRMHSSVNKIMGKKSTLTSRKRHLSKKGIDITDFTDLVPGIDSKDGEGPLEWAFNEKYGIKESYEYLPHNTGAVAHRLFGKQDDGSGLGYAIENGSIKNFLPDAGMFKMDGTAIGADTLDADDNTASYKIEGMFTAFKGSMKNGGDGKESLIMDAYDDNGETLDNDSTKNIHDAYGDSELNQTIVMAVRNEHSGDLYYKEIDITDPQIQNVMKNAIGDDDDIKGVVDQENESMGEMLKIESLSKEEETRMRTAVGKVNSEVFENNGVFEGEGSAYFGAGSAGQQNRYPMMRSFYSAIDFVGNSKKGDPNIHQSQVKKAVDAGMFTNFAISGQIEDQLKDYGQGSNPYAIVDNWYKNMDASTDNKQAKTDYKNIALKWKQLMTLQDKN
jgi:hypothetical protein